MHWTLPRAMVLLVVLAAGCGGRNLGPGQDGPTGDAAAPFPDAPPALDARPLPDYPDAAVACSIRLGLQRLDPALQPPTLPPGPPSGDPRRLAPGQLASRLARFLWGDLADPALVEKIAACPPQTAREVQDLARQMLADPRARKGVEGFFAWWLNLQDVTRLRAFPAFKPELIDAIAAEPARFGAHVVFDGGGRFDTLLTAPYSLLDATLAAHYGLTGVSGADFTKVPLDATRRMGFLTQAGVLIQGGGDADTNPTYRGRFIRERILCQPVPDHPPAADPEPQPIGQTKRQWLTASTQPPICLQCHEAMDPMGLAFEHYDGMGQYRADDKGRPIDTAGRLPGGQWPPEGTFAGPLDLIARLAKTEIAARCFSAKMLEYALGRVIDERHPWRQELERYFLADGGDIKSLMVNITITEPFLAPPTQ